MTDKELKENGWKPTICKIGTLYFNRGFFCSFKDDDTVAVFSISDDMNPLGYAKTFDEINELTKKFDIQTIESAKDEVEFLKKRFKDEYGEKYEEELPKGKAIAVVSLKVSEVNDYNTGNGEQEVMFMIKPTKDLPGDFKPGDRLKMVLIKE